MTPPTAECLKNLSVKDEYWDKCVRRSSIGIGIGSLLGGVSSLYFGTGSVVLSISMCVTWAIKHCRSLFREQEEAKRRLTLDLNQPGTTTSFADPSLGLNKTDILEKSESPTKEDLSIQKQCPGSTFSFPSVFPIPDRPFGRMKKDLSEEQEEIPECNCVVVEDDETLKIQCTCPLPESDEYKATDSCIDTKKIPNFFIQCVPEIAPQTSPPAEPYPSVPLSDEKCTCSLTEQTPTFLPLEPKCTCSPPELEPVCTCPPPEPEPKCTCPLPEPEPKCTCPPPKPEPKCTCPPPQPECTCPPKPRCTCPP